MSDESVTAEEVDTLLEGVSTEDAERAAAMGRSLGDGPLGEEPAHAHRGTGDEHDGSGHVLHDCSCSCWAAVAVVSLLCQHLIGLW